MHLDADEIRGRARRALTERIAPLRIAATAPLTVEVQDLPGEPEPFDAVIGRPFRPAVPGERWGAPWATRWFRITGEPPAAWDPGRTELVAELGFRHETTGFQLEGLAWSGTGERVKGVHPASRWIPADRVRDADGRILAYLEAAANPVVLEVNDGGVPVGFRPTPLGDPATAGDDPLY